MRITQYQVDAFADRPFRGNPAAVCFLEAWPDERLLQAIAAENNLSETAFLVPAETGYALRWFIPLEVLAGQEYVAVFDSEFTEMITVQVRLYEELNRVLRPEERKGTVQQRLPANSTVCDLVHSLGLELEEVDLALVNSGPTPFHHLLQDRDRVSLYPEFEAMDISSVSLLRGSPLRKTRFIAEGSLQELAGLLREQGYDCPCPDQAADEELARISREQKRILLTVRPGLARERALQRCICLRSGQPQQQLYELRHRLQLQ